MIAILEYRNYNDMDIFGKEMFKYFYDVTVTDKNILQLRYIPYFKTDILNKDTGRLVGWEKLIEKFKTQLDKAKITIIEDEGRYILTNKKIMKTFEQSYNNLQDFICDDPRQENDIYEDYERDEDGNLLSACCGEILGDHMICPECKEHC